VVHHQGRTEGRIAVLALGGRVVCIAHEGSTLLTPSLSRFASSLNGYEWTWRLGFLDAGRTLTATESVTFKSAGVTVSNPAFKAKIGQPAGAKLILIGKPVYSTAVAGTTFGASQSARLQFSNGAQQEINWKT
jgi:hypothetical protein